MELVMMNLRWTNEFWFLVLFVHTLDLCVPPSFAIT